MDMPSAYANGICQVNQRVEGKLGQADKPTMPAMSKRSDAAKRWQHAQVARGGCHECGNRRQPGSKSRCAACLERARLYERDQRGVPGDGKRKRGRPMLGTVGARRRALRDEEPWRQRVWGVDASPPQQKAPAPVRRWHFEHPSGGVYRFVWDSDG